MTTEQTAPFATAARLTYTGPDRARISAGTVVTFYKRAFRSTTEVEVFLGGDPSNRLRLPIADLSA